MSALTHGLPIEAHRWWVNGDHPRDGVGEPVTEPDSGQTYPRVEGKVVRFYNHPDIPGENLCGHCHRQMQEHGFIDYRSGLTVCPGNFVLTGHEPGEYYPCQPGLLTLLVLCIEQVMPG